MDDAYWILCTLDKEEIYIYTGIFTCIFDFWSLPVITEKWEPAVLISGLLYGSGTSCCRLWESAGGTSKCNRRHKRSVKKKKSRKKKSTE